jgi:hypothetical protein
VVNSTWMPRRCSGGGDDTLLAGLGGAEQPDQAAVGVADHGERRGRQVDQCQAELADVERDGTVNIVDGQAETLGPERRHGTPMGDIDAFRGGGWFRCERGGYGDDHTDRRDDDLDPWDAAVGVGVARRAGDEAAMNAATMPITMVSTRARPASPARR